MRELISQSLYCYWNEIRAGRIAPKRFEVEPSQIAAQLPHTFILERKSPKCMAFRLAGTHICEAFGTEFRGINIMDLVGEEDRITLERQMSVIARQGAVGVFTFTSENPFGRHVQWEMLVLPLVHLNNDIDRFLGSVAMHDKPSWLGQEPLVSHRLIENRLIWPDGRPHILIDAARRQTPFHARTQESRLVRANRRQFRVYNGGLAGNDDH
jgi:hypothetical protein